MGEQSRSKTAFSAALSTRDTAVDAVAEACEEALGGFPGGGPPDLAFVFFSADHLNAADEMAASICERLGTEQVLGCGGESIVGRGQEVELSPAVSIWLARLPDAEIRLMHLEYEQTADGGSFKGWMDALPDEWPDTAAMIVQGDPFSFPADVFLQLINDEHPGVPVVGGMASAAQAPNANRLLLGPRSFATGAVAAYLERGVAVRTIVSQGCRPIGKHFVVTKAERNVIEQLGGASAFQRLEEVFQQLPAREQAMIQQGLHVGRVVSEYQDMFEQGDFLVRNVVGADPEQGVIAIADYVRAGQTVQFHIRDAETADAELRQLLRSATQAAADTSPPQAALLFTCNGRGTRLFSEPHHDAAAVQSEFGPIPLAGFFAAGELGPIAGRNFMHGFTASIAVFE